MTLVVELSETEGYLLGGYLFLARLIKLSRIFLCSTWMLLSQSFNALKCFLYSSVKRLRFSTQRPQKKTKPQTATATIQ